MLACLTLLTPLVQHKPVQIPEIASVLGFRMGYSTVEEFEKRLGKGFASVGGHPMGRRSWWDKKNGVFITLDGFEYARNGRLVDELELESCPLGREVRPVTLQPKTYGFWLTSIRFGMKKADVLSALKKKGWNPKSDGDDIVLESKGHLVFPAQTNYASLVIEQWRTVLDFRDARLVGIRFSAS